MKKITTLTLLISLSLSVFSQTSTPKIKPREYSSIISLNLGTTALLRPQVSYERLFGKDKGLEITGGYIMPFTAFQNATVKYTKADYFLYNGFMGGLAYKFYTPGKDGYIGFRGIYKNMKYSNSEWTSGYKEGDVKAGKYILSNARQQFGIHIETGNMVPLGSSLKLHYYIGFGYRYSISNPSVQQEIYSNEFYRFSGFRPFPSSTFKTIDINPVVTLGLKLAYPF